MLGGWIALTPELAAKLLFGRHVWDCAQHADLWGRRLPELRASAQQSEPANDRGRRASGPLKRPRAGRTETVERVTAIYRVLKPHLLDRLRAAIWRCANPVYEPPTRRILARCLEEERRHAAAGALVLARLTPPIRRWRRGRKAWERQLLAALRARPAASPAMWRRR